MSISATLSKLAAVLPVMVGLLALVGAADAVSAETQGLQQSAVRVTQDDLATRKGRRALDRRIGAAVEKVCAPGTGSRVRDQSCTSQAAAQARRDIAAQGVEFTAAQVGSR